MATPLELVHHRAEVRVPGSKSPGEPVPAAGGNVLAVGDYIELPPRARNRDCLDVQSLPDQGHETRDLSLVVLSGGAVDDFYVHALRFRLEQASSGSPRRIVSSAAEASTGSRMMVKNSGAPTIAAPRIVVAQIALFARIVDLLMT